MKILKETTSICPECNEEGRLNKISARIIESDGKVLYEKECEEHGRFQDVYWSDSELYKRAEKFRWEGKGPVVTRIEKEGYNCPEDCVESLTGLCGYHKTRTCLGIVDVTNRCNLRCPTCFANAGAMDYVYEPSIEELENAFQALKDNASRAVQLTGGEPTVREDLPEIAETARKYFHHVEINTNGIRLARDKEFLSKLGRITFYVSYDTENDPTVYDQFRGNGIYDPNTRRKKIEKITGQDLISIKKKAIDNIEKVGSHAVLVPTIGMNNINQVWPIVEYALGRGEVIRGVNFQPVSFGGRGSIKERATIPDLILQIEEHTYFRSRAPRSRQSKMGYPFFQGAWLSRDDWYPVPTVGPLFDIAEHYSEEPTSSFTVHPHCGMATILIEMEVSEILSSSPEPLQRTNLKNILRESRGSQLIFQRQRFSKDRTWIPLPRLLNVEKTHKALSEIAKGLSKTGLGKVPGRLKAAYSYYFKFKEALKEASPFIRKSVGGIMDKRDYSSLRDFFGDRRVLFLGIMHFQDPNNIDFERVRRCGIHQAYPDGSLLPFCIINSGLAAKNGMSTRDAKMRQFGVSWEEYLNQKQ